MSGDITTIENLELAVFDANLISTVDGYDEEISAGLDEYAQKKAEIRSQYHNYLDGMFAKRVLDVLGIKLNNRGIN